MHQARKGNQWYFGMKTHIVVGSKTKLIHSIALTPANVHDSQVFCCMETKYAYEEILLMQDREIN